MSERIGSDNCASSTEMTRQIGNDIVQKKDWQQDIYFISDISLIFPPHHLDQFFSPISDSLGGVSRICLDTSQCD